MLNGLSKLTFEKQHKQGKAGKQATKKSTAARSQQSKLTPSPGQEPEALTVKVDSDGSAGSSPLSDLMFADYTESSLPWDNSGT